MQIMAVALLATLAQTPSDVEGAYERVSITNVTTGGLAEARQPESASHHGPRALFDDDHERVGMAKAPLM